MLFKKRIVLFAVASVFCAQVATRANAQCEMAIMVFDMSGSMLSNGSTGDPKWQIARDKALVDFGGIAAGTTVGIYTFTNATIGGTPYKNIVIPLSAGKVKGTHDMDLISIINGLGSAATTFSPIAGSACDAIEDAFVATPATCPYDTARNVYLYTDGEENSTPVSHACYSSFSSTTPFDEDAYDAGFGLTPYSWEWKVANKAWTLDPNDETQEPWTITPILHINLLFDWITVSGWRPTGLAEGGGLSAGTYRSAITPDMVAFYSGLSHVTHGTYFEAKLIGGQPTVPPVPGDTNPEPLCSCVDGTDMQAILAAYGRSVADNDPYFTIDELAARDINDDLIIDIEDYFIALQNIYVGCSDPNC